MDVMKKQISVEQKKSKKSDSDYKHSPEPSEE